MYIIIKKQFVSQKENKRQFVKEKRNIFLVKKKKKQTFSKMLLLWRLGSQAIVVKESSKSSPLISIDVVLSEKVAPTKAKMETLTAELERKNFEQEMIIQKMEHLKRRFGNIMPNMNSSIQPEG